MAHIYSWFILAAAAAVGTQALTHYEYYAPDGVTTSGLTARGETFTLNGKEISIYSGAFHYFRIHPSYWRDTLQKLRAAGLNAVETYMPWNLHNPRIDFFDYGDQDEDMSEFLDIETFINMAMEEDLFVILRPGPYICSEWDFGGLPGWLLRDPTMKVRSYHTAYRAYVDAYFASFAPILSNLTFTKGGPIMAIQIENEYGAFGYEDNPRDKLYLEDIKGLLDKYGLDDALYFTSDSPADTLDWGALPGVFMTANFKDAVDTNLDTLKNLQPDSPLMVMEFWTGWFDHWIVDEHQTWSPSEFNATLEAILQKPASVNMYMFIGGTNFGFMAGANKDSRFPDYKPTITSYDYDALLTEAGDYTEKYDMAKSLFELYSPLTGIVDTPTEPLERTKIAYGSFPIEETIPFQSLVDQVSTNITLTEGPINMEALDLNNGSGQLHGYVLYTTSVTFIEGEISTLLIRGHVRDMAQVIVGGTVVTKQLSESSDLNEFGFWYPRDASVNFTSPGGTVDLHILVENLGRVNYGEPNFFEQKKGLWEGPVYLNGVELTDWTVKPLEFKKSFVTELTDWEPFTESQSTPSTYKAMVNITTTEDTFLDMSLWGKGVVFVNGFNLGRFWSVGPTHTLYIPGPLLVAGDNEFIVFEQYDANTELTFIDFPILD